MERQARCLLIFVLMGCSEEELAWPPPPAEAVASCVYELPDGGFQPRSTLWYDVNDRVIRIDGFDENDRAGAHYYTYDGEGRLVFEDGPDYEFRYHYTADEIIETGVAGTWSMKLENGRPRSYEGPLENLISEQRITNFEYDAAGRLIRHYGRDPNNEMFTTRYTYDAQDRLASVTIAGKLTTITYTETSSQLVVDQVGLMTAHFSIDFDASGRIVRVGNDESHDGIEDTIATFTYSDGMMEERIEYDPQTLLVIRATGRCDRPTISLSAPSWLPITNQASYRSFHDITAGSRVHIH